MLDWVSLHTALLLSVRMLLMCPVGISSASEVCGQMINGNEHTVPHLMTYSVYDNTFFPMHEPLCDAVISIGMAN